MEIVKQYFDIPKKVLNMKMKNNLVDLIREGIYFYV